MTGRPAVRWLAALLFVACAPAPGPSPHEDAGVVDDGDAGVVDDGDAGVVDDGDAGVVDDGDAGHVDTAADAGPPAPDGPPIPEAPITQSVPVDDAVEWPPGCRDGFADDFETDVDCGGGSCPRCEPGRACLADTDCAVGRCVSNRCLDDAPACTSDAACEASSLCLTAPSGRRTCRRRCDPAGTSCGPGQACFSMDGAHAGCVPAPNESTRWKVGAIRVWRDTSVRCPPSAEATFPGGLYGTRMDFESNFTSGQQVVIGQFSEGSGPYALLDPPLPSGTTRALSQTSASVALVLGGSFECLANHVPSALFETLDLRPRWAGESARFVWRRTSPPDPSRFLDALEFRVEPAH